MLGMDTDTEFYTRFGTMTGPDVLIISRKWVDADPARASKFMKAYFEAVEWTDANPDSAGKLVHKKYIQQPLEDIQKSIKKIVWHGADAQHKVMSDAGIFGQAEHVIDILHGQMKTIPVKPKFREWVNMSILPHASEKARAETA